MFFVVWSFSNSMEDFTVLVYLLYHILGLMFASKELLFIYLQKKKTLFHVYITLCMINPIYSVQLPSL